MRFVSVLICVLCISSASTAIPPTVDGFLDDPFWSTDARVWTTYRPDLPGHSARFHLGFDDDTVYFAADVNDPDVTGTSEKHLENIFRDDAVQLFLDTGDAESAGYAPIVHQYGFSVAGAVNWYRVADGGTGPAATQPATWDSAVRRAVILKPGSTLNNHRDLDNGYIIEAAIPWQELGINAPPNPERTIGVCFINTFNNGGTTDGTGIPATAPQEANADRAVPRLWERIRIGTRRPLALRGLTESLPLWLGTTMYANQWQRFEKAETDPAGPWLNRSRWQSKLDHMASLGYNALLLLHPHPYSGLLRLQQYPGASHFPPDELPPHMDQFRWLLAEAKARGIRIYLLTWNICLPPKWANANGLAELGADTPLSRAYTRQAVKELFETYPDLAGLATMAAESPPGCVDFVVDAVAGGMNDARKASASRPSDHDALPELIFWSWCTYPEDARRVVESYPDARLMHYLQYEQWFKPMVDPRLARFATWATAAPLGQARTATSSIALGGPKSALACLFWGDPEWLRLITNDLRRQGAEGLFFEPYCPESWLAQEAFTYYAANPSSEFDRAKWARRLEEFYGVAPHGGQLLEAMQHASAVVPRFLALIHSQSDHFMPQFGVSLAHYLEMPTLSSYVFENTQTLNDRGYLTPRLGLTWPNPDWGERVASIRETVAGTAPAGATLPTEIAREIELHAMACRSRLTALRQIQPQSGDQAKALAVVLDRLGLNAALGEHFSRKIRAALAWERLKVGKGGIEDCTEPLESSIQAWQAVCDISGRLYPKPLRFWQSQIVSPPAWTQNQIWNSYRLVQGHWRDQLPRFQRELDLVQRSLSLSIPRANLPMWDHFDADPDDNLVSLHRITFQNDSENDRRFKLGSGASITGDAQSPISEGKTLLADTRSLGQGHHEILSTVPEFVTLPAGAPCQITLVYRVIDRGGAEAAPFEMGVRSLSGGPVLGDHRYWGAADGHVGTRVLKVPPLADSDCAFCLIIHGQAAIAIDMINIQARKTP